LCARKKNGQIINATSNGVASSFALMVLSVLSAVGSMIRRRQEGAMVMEASAA